MHKDDIPWIVGIQTRRDRGEDALMWHYTMNGDYTVANLESWIPWAIDYTNSLLQRDINTKNQQTNHGKRSWTAPTAGTFMVNCDASVVSNLKGYGLAAVIRDAEGRLVAAEVKFKSGFVSVITAELLAVQLGLLLVQKMQARPFLDRA
ncbi:hypothetical protein F8388_014881 [Cannabis sativa]|uniref:RNase H type-1 domain-containing protein n=1 Tax=Cannabis sativa TaxID=3483 RepID=A0A7J6F624_CANSA|nr:hypothetical protein F8388_014881 [Cannabis sativa]KAF4395584.1 hypothetical protein G4B88_011048 [Cannabis sativa]